MQIFVYKNGQQLGPYSEADIKNQLAAGILTPQDMVWWEGQAGWVPVEQTPLMAGVPAAAVMAAPPSHSIPASVGAAATSRTSGLAIASLVCGLAMFIVGLTFIPAIVCGHMGLSEIRRNPGMKGRGMAITGLVLGYVFPVLFFIAVVAISVLLALGQTVKETFKTINSQLEMAQTNDASDTTTNTPDTTTNAPATTTPDATNAPATNTAPDTTTNAPTTNTPPANGQ